MPTIDPLDYPYLQYSSGAVQESHGQSITEVWLGEYKTLLEQWGNWYVDAMYSRPQNWNVDNTAYPMPTINTSGQTAETQQFTVVSTNLAGRPGGIGTLTVVARVGSTGGETPSQARVKKTTWSMRNVQQNVSIYRYLSPSYTEGKKDVELWREEKDNALFSQKKYMINGQVVTLSGGAAKLAEKFAAGIEEVMRFYPVIQKVRIYSSWNIHNVGDDLTEIGAPSGCPSGWITGWQWLKIGDDVVCNSDGSATRTESWMGAETFDTNLYGSSRWAFGSLTASS